MANVVIESFDELVSALERFDQLYGYPQGTDQQRELEHVSDALIRYENHIAELLDDSDEHLEKGDETGDS